MLNWSLYRESFTTAEMRRIWSEGESIATWLQVEQVLAQRQAAAGLIPSAAADAIAAVSPAQLDQGRLAEDMKTVGRPIVGLVKQLRSLAGAEHGPYVHYRTTTQDIMDTALSLQMKRGIAAILAQLEDVINLLADLGAANAATRIMGRTNGQFALPMSFATKLQVWLSELEAPKGRTARSRRAWPFGSDRRPRRRSRRLRCRTGSKTEAERRRSLGAAACRAALAKCARRPCRYRFRPWRSLRVARQDLPQRQPALLLRYRRSP